jgi:hypothetical protein
MHRLQEPRRFGASTHPRPDLVASIVYQDTVRQSISARGISPTLVQVHHCAVAISQICCVVFAHSQLNHVSTIDDCTVYTCTVLTILTSQRESLI